MNNNENFTANNKIDTACFMEQIHNFKSCIFEESQAYQIQYVNSFNEFKDLSKKDLQISLRSMVIDQCILLEIMYNSLFQSGFYERLKYDLTNKKYLDPINTNINKTD